MLTGVSTCSILLSGFSSSSVRINSSLSKPYSPSWPKKKKIKHHKSVQYRSHQHLCTHVTSDLNPAVQTSGPTVFFSGAHSVSHSDDTQTAAQRDSVHSPSELRIYFKWFCVSAVTHRQVLLQRFALCLQIVPVLSHKHGISHQDTSTFTPACIHIHSCMYGILGVTDEAHASLWFPQHISVRIM